MDEHEKKAREIVRESLEYDQEYGSRGDFMRKVLVPIITTALTEAVAEKEKEIERVKNTGRDFARQCDSYREQLQTKDKRIKELEVKLLLAKDALKEIKLASETTAKMDLTYIWEIAERTLTQIEGEK